MGINSEFYKDLSGLGSGRAVSREIRRHFPDAVSEGTSEYGRKAVQVTYTSDDMGQDVGYLEMDDDGNVVEAWRLWEERAYG